MKNVICRLSKIILIYVILFTVVFIASRHFLSILGFEYRRWVFYGLEIILISGIIVGIAQMIIKIKRSKLKKVCAVLLAVSIVIITPIVIFAHAFGYQPLYVVTKHNYKMDAYIRQSHHVTDISYYDYINLFIRGKNRRLQERYWGRVDNPFDNSNEIISLTWFDDNGKAIQE